MNALLHLFRGTTEKKWNEVHDDELVFALHEVDTKIGTFAQRTTATLREIHVFLAR